MDRATMAENRLVADAVERCLERISEAAAKLCDQAVALVPNQPWHEIRALGNRLRHAYDQIDQSRIWEIVEGDLPKLLSACQTALDKFGLS
jgi:uncharacterized protein with HEPN domain